MTTNAIDRVNKLVASDSRWSMPLDGNRIAYVDDTGFDKLANRQFHTMAFAGDGILIEQWKHWFSAETLDFDNLPPFQRLEGNTLVTLYFSLVQKPDCTVIFNSGWWIHHGEHASFAGSGATHAYDCFVLNGCGKRAIVSASANDPATGGEIKFVELVSGFHNLNHEQTTLAHVIQQLNLRGFVMDTNTKVITPIKDLQQATVEALRALESGERSLTAPTGLPMRCWTESQKDVFKNALRDVSRQEAEAQR
jgi:hypothetical protein